MATTWHTVEEALVEAVGRISQAAGYRTELGRCVRRWQAEPPDWAELPVVEVRLGTASLERSTYGETLTRYEGEVLLQTPGGTPLETLRLYAADLLQALGADPTLGGFVERLVVGEIAVEPGDPERVSDAVRLEVAATLAMTPWTL